MRACRPMNELAAVCTERFHSCIAATKRLAMPVVGRDERLRKALRANVPDQNTCSKRSIARCILAKSSVLLMMIAQHQTDAPSRPSMTNLTTICADRNMLQSETSAAGEAIAAAATSVGFIHSRPCKAAVEMPGIRAGRPSHAPETGAAPPTEPRPFKGLSGGRFKSLREMPSIIRNFLIGPAVNPFLTCNSVISWAFPLFVSLKCDAFS